MLTTRPSPSNTASTTLGLHSEAPCTGTNDDAASSAPASPSTSGAGAARFCCLALLPRVQHSPGASSCGGLLQPSTKTASGRAGKPWMARAMAARDACRMLYRSISSTDASAMHHATRPWNLLSVSCSKSSSRFASVNFFESLTADSNSNTSLSFQSNTTNAAATTGPARGPRPASSVPATTACPLRSNFASYFRTAQRTTDNDTFTTFIRGLSRTDVTTPAARACDGPCAADAGRIFTARPVLVTATCMWTEAAARRVRTPARNVTIFGIR
mmetsp:Transcript_53080/g.153061  ORF Transcript_53080/g.153061 Transcript_53080/m.153061 type:complete len:272 (-) Transcript_53080:48-863(-)